MSSATVIRQDGEQTRRRILDAACAVFGEAGYTKATHAEIARRAGVNSALINFHFRAKEKLYHAAWDELSAMTERKWPHDGGVPADAAPEERLRGLISALVHRAVDPEIAGLHHILMMENANPTGIIDQAIRQRLAGYRSRTQALVREMLGPKADDESVVRCEMSIIAQTRALRADRHGAKHWGAAVGDIDALIEHIAQFSLGGIARIRVRLERGGAR